MGERNSKALEFSKSTRQANENRYRKPKGAYRWIVSADGTNGYATILIKRIGNYLKAFAVHFHALGWRETEISDFCTVLRRYRTNSGNRACRRRNCKCFKNIDAGGNQAASCCRTLNEKHFGWATNKMEQRPPRIWFARDSKLAAHGPLLNVALHDYDFYSLIKPSDLCCRSYRDMGEAEAEALIDVSHACS